MNKNQIEATKQKAIKLLQENISKQQKNGFGGFMAQELGVTQGLITRIKDGTRPLTLERAMQIIEVVPLVLKNLENIKKSRLNRNLEKKQEKEEQKNEKKQEKEKSKFDNWLKKQGVNKDNESDFEIKIDNNVKTLWKRIVYK